MFGQQAFDIEQHAARFSEGADGFGPHSLELPVCHRQQNGVVCAFAWRPGQRNAIFMPGFRRVRPRIADLHLRPIALEPLNDVHDAGVADIRAVFLKRQPEHQHARPPDGEFFLRHQLAQPADDIGAHAVIGAAPGQNHFRVKAELLRFVRQIIRIHANAMSAHQTRAERQEIPFGSRRRQHLVRLDFHAVEQHGQFVDERDIHIGPSDYVDWLGLSVYGKINKAEGWADFVEMMDQPYREITRLDADKPVFLAEWGVGEFPPGDKAGFITTVFDRVPVHYPRVRLAVFWHERWENSDGSYSNLRVNSSPEALAAYRKGVAAPYWIDRPLFAPKTGTP